MGPTAEALALADGILRAYPEITVNRIDLAYTIMEIAEREFPATKEPK